VGVVGAAGAVGRAVLNELLRLGVGPVRAAVRRPPDRPLPAGARLWSEPVDVTDAPALAAFCAECRVVVNAAGPVRAVGHRVAAAALAAGADLVDVNDTAELPGPPPYARLLRWRTTVIGAGLMPGLAGLLPGLLVADGAAARRNAGMWALGGEAPGLGAPAWVTVPGGRAGHARQTPAPAPLGPTAAGRRSAGDRIAGPAPSAAWSAGGRPDSASGGRPLDGRATGVPVPRGQAGASAAVPATATATSGEAPTGARAAGDPATGGALTEPGVSADGDATADRAETARAALTVRVGGLPHFPPAAARDFMERLARPGGEVTAVWRGGRRVPGALAVERDARLPYFPGTVTAIPYLTEEAVGVARRYGVGEVRWYTVFGGEHARAILDRYRAGLPPGRTVDEAAAELSRATLTDLAGRSPHQVVTCELDGRGLVLTGTDSSALTGTTAAHAALALLSGELPPGQLHFAGLPEPSRIAQRLAEAPAVTGLRLLDGPLAELPVEEGIL
jgi:hypothetical protein